MRSLGERADNKEQIMLANLIRAVIKGANDFTEAPADRELNGKVKGKLTKRAAKKV
jgi:hypothetical protein